MRHVLGINIPGELFPCIDGFGCSSVDVGINEPVVGRIRVENKVVQKAAPGMAEMNKSANGVIYYLQEGVAFPRLKGGRARR